MNYTNVIEAKETELAKANSTTFQVHINRGQNGRYSAAREYIRIIRM